MSKIFELITYIVYFIGIGIVLFAIILDKKDSKKIPEVFVPVYVKKKRCVWDNKLNDISYVVDVVYSNEIFKIKDKILFDNVQENSSIKMRLIERIDESGESEINLVYDN